MRSRLIPLLSEKGFFALFGFVLMPIFSLLVGASFLETILIVLAFILLIFFFLVKDYLRLKSFLKEFHLGANIVEHSYSGKELRIGLKIDTPECKFPLLLRLRPEIEPSSSLEPSRVEFLLQPGMRSVSSEQSFTPWYRGELNLKKVWLRLESGRGLITWQTVWTLAKPKLVKIYPNPNLLGKERIRIGKKFAVGGQILERSGSRGREFDRLNLYSRGDDLRHVDWKRSARRGDLLVRLYRPETNQRVIVALDCSRRMQSPLDGRFLLDFAADAAAHLSSLVLAAEDELGFFAFSHKVLAEQRPCKGKNQQRQMFQYLSALQAGDFEPDYSLLRSWAGSQRRRALLLLITSITSPGAIDGLQKTMQSLSRRHLPLVVAISDRKLVELLQHSPSSEQEALVSAAAYGRSLAIEKKISRLKSSGIECIYSDAKNLSADLNKKYYQLKISGRL